MMKVHLPIEETGMSGEGIDAAEVFIILELEPLSNSWPNQLDA